MNTSAMTGEEMRRLREERGLGQNEFADWLNHHLGRRYDRSKVSRWETGAEKIPSAIALALGETGAGGKPAGIPAVTAGAPRASVKIAISNQKGGVAKTTTAVNLSYLLAKAGLRVLLIDGDAQANATAHMGCDAFRLDEEGATLYHVMLKDRPVVGTIVPVCSGRFDLLPSSLTLSVADAELLGAPAGILVLREKLDEIEGRYDVIIIDCPPNLGQLTINALNAADCVLIPVETEPMAAQGITLLTNTIAKIRRRVNPNLTILGILPTRYAAGHSMDRITLAQIQETYGEKLRIFSPVPSSTQYPQGSSAGRPTLEAEPKAPGAQSYQEVAEAIAGLVKTKSAEAAHV